MNFYRYFQYFLTNFGKMWNRIFSVGFKTILIVRNNWASYQVVVIVFMLLHYVIYSICPDMSVEHLPPYSVWLNWSMSTGLVPPNPAIWFAHSLLPPHFSIHMKFQSPWRWRQYICQKHQNGQSALHSVRTQKIDWLDECTAMVFSLSVPMDLCLWTKQTAQL